MFITTLRLGKAFQSGSSAHVPSGEDGCLEKEPVFTRVERPTRIDAARRLGYKQARRSRYQNQSAVVDFEKGKVHMKRPSKVRCIQDYNG